MRGKAKRIRWLLAVLFLTVPIQAQYGGGTGEPNDPYLIYTPEQMNAIGAEPNDWDKHFKLMADIDLSGYTGTDFNIIGNGLFPAFTGVFEGNGRTISNFTCSSTDEPCIGIFGYIDDPNALICNVGLIDPNVDGGTGVGVGSLAGWVEAGTISHCYAVNSIVIGRKVVGGLVGISAGVITDCYAEGVSIIAEESVGGLIGSNSGSITDCHATGNVTGRYGVGGLVGSNNGYGRRSGAQKPGILEECYAAGNVFGEYTSGGLVGINKEGTLTNCFSKTGIFGKNRIGGLAGLSDGRIIGCRSDGSIDALDQAGGLAGTNDGIVTACYSSAGVYGQGETGGLVGYNSYNGEIVNCCAQGNAIGQDNVGGLVGNNTTAVPRAGVLLSGTILYCYSTGLVSGDRNVGGLVGRNGEGGVSSSFWDIETSGQTASAGGEGKTTLEMHDLNTFIETGWDFIGAPGGPGDIWAESGEGGYPVLWWQVSPLPELPAFSGGTGEPNNPYLISTVSDLNNIGHNPRLMTAHLKLIHDIDLSGVDFYVISNRYYPFRGVFNGNDHIISNFSYTSQETTGVGFFRYMDGGRIENLTLIDPNVHVDKGDFHGALVGYLEAGIITRCHGESGNVTGRDGIGGLVGKNGSDGVIINCSSTGVVAGRDDIGGLSGQNGGIIATSYSYADVQGRNAVGGLVGRCSPGDIDNCYAQGNVIGAWYVGGLVGSNGSRLGRDVGDIRSCYSTTTILGSAQNGGLLGIDWGGEVSLCFWDVETSGLTTSYGGMGKTTAEMQTAVTFLQAGWDFVDETVNGAEDIWWILEGQGYPKLWWESIP